MAAERAVRPLLEVLDGCLGEPWLAVLAAHLGAGSQSPDAVRAARRFATARHLADLFDRYALHRPEMVRSWAGGAGETWQAELWRRLRARLALPSVAECLADAAARLREDAGAVDLPERLSLFGLTRLLAGHLAVLRAIAAHRDVYLFLLHPSPALWERVADAVRPGAPIVRRSEDHTATLAANRLLASWGQDAREMQLVLVAADDDGVVDHHHPAQHPAATLLGRIQADVRADRRRVTTRCRAPNLQGDRASSARLNCFTSAVALPSRSGWSTRSSCWSRWPPSRVRGSPGDQCAGGPGSSSCPTSDQGRRADRRGGRDRGAQGARGRRAQTGCAGVPG